jgi:energy-coupling factor transport system ATP-binding protein
VRWPSRCVKGPGRPVISFESVDFRYHSGAPLALDGVSLTLDAGEFVAVVGANGSGKSTLARLCDGLLAPSAGRVLVDGLDTVDPGSLWTVRSLVGMVFQDPDDQIVGTVVEEDCAFGPENIGLPSAEIRRRVDAALHAVGLDGLERREPHLLSEGQKQRLAVAGALAMRPRYLVFDEPTAMLDPEGRRSVLEIADRLAHAEGHGVLIVSHDTAGVARADRVIGLAAGRIVFDGSPEGLLGDAVLLAGVGLALPPAARLASALRRRGLDVPVAAADAESVVDALWR